MTLLLRTFLENEKRQLENSIYNKKKYLIHDCPECEKEYMKQNHDQNKNILTEINDIEFKKSPVYQFKINSTKDDLGIRKKTKS